LSETGAGAVELQRQLLFMQQSSNVTINTSICHIPEVAAMAVNHTELAEMCGHLLAAPIIPDYVMIIIQVFYALVCMLGLLGNSLVIYVVLRFSKMHTVKPQHQNYCDALLCF
jgi:phosphoribosylformylglycinamidine (FGAM) synthase PurS component